MHHQKNHTQFIRQLHKLLLYNTMGTGIRPSTITHDYKCTCTLILFLKMFFPDSIYIVTNEHSRIMACPNGHISNIPCDIVNAVRNNLSI